MMKRADHIARMPPQRWCKIITEWDPRCGGRSKGRPKELWADPIRKWVSDYVHETSTSRINGRRRKWLGRHWRDRASTSGGPQPSRLIRANQVIKRRKKNLTTYGKTRPKCLE